MSEDTKWRVGRKFPLYVCEGDTPMCECNTPKQAARIVELLNAGARNEGPGTPMGRIEALSSYAETNCGYNPAGARGPETAIVEHIARLQAECAMLRAKETLLLASGEFISALGYAGDLNAVAATMWLAEHDKQVESDADHKWIGYVKKHLSGLHPSIETYEDAAQAIKRAGEGSTKAWRAGAFAMRNIYQGYGKGVYNIPEPPAPERSTE